MPIEIFSVYYMPPFFIGVVVNFGNLMPSHKVSLSIPPSLFHWEPESGVPVSGVECDGRVLIKHGVATLMRRGPMPIFSAHATRFLPPLSWEMGVWTNAKDEAISMWLFQVGIGGFHQQVDRGEGFQVRQIGLSQRGRTGYPVQDGPGRLQRALLEPEPVSGWSSYL